MMTVANTYNGSHSVYKMEVLIRMILHAGVIGGDNSLARSIESAGELIGFEEKWLQNAEDMCIPSRTTIVRHRFTLDAGLCLCVQQRLKVMLDSGQPLFVYYLADASPRQGHDWFLSECYISSESQARLFLACQDELCEMRSTDQWQTDRARDRGQEEVELQEAFMLHVCFLHHRSRSLQTCACECVRGTGAGTVFVRVC